MTVRSIQFHHILHDGYASCAGTAPGGDMLVYAQGMYIMHVPFNPTAENPGSQTLYIPGSTLLFTFVAF